MPVPAIPLSHGAILEALRSAQDDLRFVCSICPEIHDRSLDQAIHMIACASRRIFESYVHDSERSSEETIAQMILQAAA